MSNSLFTFTSSSTHELPSSPDVLTVTVDPTTGELVVTHPDVGTTSYSLVDDNGNPTPRTIFLDGDADPEEFQLGTVTYAREGYYVQYFALNDYDITFTVQRTGGHLGILDIRDIGKQYPPKTYYFDMMPVILSISGNNLTVKTLEYDVTDPYGPWYS